MNTTIKKTISRVTVALACAALLLTSNVAMPGAAIVGEELAVLQAMAAIINRDAPHPFEQLYFESAFETAPYVTTSIENPDRNQFCGLTRSEALALVDELETVTARPVLFDKETAKSAGLKLGRRKNPSFPYVILSRPVFGPGKQFAWVAVELNGSSGAVMRLDKIDGEWKQTSRCGGWMMAAE
jgi:hypothetical protein